MGKTLVQCRLAKAGPVVTIDYPPGFKDKADERRHEKAFFVGQSPSMLTFAEVELAKKKIADSHGTKQAIAKTGLVMVDPEHPLAKAPEATLALEEKRLGLTGGDKLRPWERVVRIVEAKALAA